MSETEREIFGINPKDLPEFVRLDSGKVNLCPATVANWFKIVGVPLGNLTDDYPHGDIVQTVEPWTPPDLWKDITPATANTILDAIDKGLSNGSRYSATPQAKDDRAAWLVILAHLPQLTEKQAKEILKTWVKNGVIEMRDYHDPNTRKPRSGAYVHPAKRPH